MVCSSVPLTQSVTHGPVELALHGNLLGRQNLMLHSTFWIIMNKLSRLVEFKLQCEKHCMVPIWSSPTSLPEGQDQDEHSTRGGMGAMKYKKTWSSGSGQCLPLRVCKHDIGTHIPWECILPSAVCLRCFSYLTRLQASLKTFDLLPVAYFYSVRNKRTQKVLVRFHIFVIGKPKLKKEIQLARSWVSDQWQSREENLWSCH